MAEPLSLAPMTLENLDEVLAIERASFVTPWSKAAFRYELTQNQVARCVVVRAGRDLVGYLCLWEIAHELHVTNLAVHPARRRQGAARMLLGSILEEAAARGVTLAFLEVRPTNAEAVALYESLGFHVIGRRKGYYVDTGEDALVMEAKLPALRPPPGGRQPASGNRGER
jgi:ribosomal-protein-alanine N-acetyltransferase